MSEAIWVYLETVRGLPTRESLELLTAGWELASRLDRPLVAVLLGHGVMSWAKGLRVDQVLVMDHPGLKFPQPSRYLEAIAHFARMSPPYVVLFPGTSLGRELAGRLAIRLGGSLISDCQAFHLEGEQLAASHLVFGGTLLAKAIVRQIPLIATMRPGVFALPSRTPTIQPEILSDAFSEDWLDTPALRLGEVQTILSPLNQASVVVGGGMGLGDPAMFQRLEALAIRLKGVVGCTRAVVEAGWRPYCEQIGLTGQTIAPRLYLAFGIHGASEHLEGIRSSQTIVAVNSDAEAPLMKMADRAIVADARAFLPALLDDWR